MIPPGDHSANPSEVTVPYQAPLTLHDGVGVGLARRAAADAQAAESVRVLLRSRLRIASLIVLVLFVLAGTLGVAGLALGLGLVRPRLRPGLIFFTGPAVAWAAL